MKKKPRAPCKCSVDAMCFVCWMLDAGKGKRDQAGKKAKRPKKSLKCWLVLAGSRYIGKQVISYMCVCVVSSYPTVAVLFAGKSRRQAADPGPSHRHHQDESRRDCHNGCFCNPQAAHGSSC